MRGCHRHWDEVEARTEAEVVACKAENRVNCDIRQKMLGAEAWMMLAM